MSDNENKGGNENDANDDDNKSDNSDDNEDEYSSFVENNNAISLNDINKIDDNKSDNNDDNNEENNESEYSSFVENKYAIKLNDIEENTKSKKKKKIGKGSEILHILPCKISNENNSIFASVDEFFEKKITENTDNNNFQYNNHFRGRLLNGRKYSINNENNNINFNYYELEQDSQKNEYKINQKLSIKTFFLWKYDEIFEKDSNTFMNINKILNDLNCLS